MTRDIEKRIQTLEAKLKSDTLSWQTVTGEHVEVTVKELLGCVSPGLKGEYHPLIDKIKQADISTYSEDGSLLELVRAVLLSVGLSEEERELARMTKDSTEVQ